MSDTWKNNHEHERSINRQYHECSQRMKRYFEMSYKQGDQAFAKWQKYVEEKGIYRAINRLREWPRSFGTMHPYYVWGLFKSPHYYTRGQGVKEACKFAEKWFEIRNTFERYSYEKQQKEQEQQREQTSLERFKEGECIRQSRMEKIMETSRDVGLGYEGEKLELEK